MENMVVIWLHKAMTKTKEKEKYNGKEESLQTKQNR